MVSSWVSLSFNPLERGMGLGGSSWVSLRSNYDGGFNPLERGMGLGGWVYVLSSISEDFCFNPLERGMGLGGSHVYGPTTG